MKLSILTPLFAATLVQAQFNAMLALLKTFKLTAPLECAMPCILESANKMPWDEAGPASAICSNIDKIAEDTKPCTQKCNSDKANGKCLARGGMTEEQALIILHIQTLPWNWHGGCAVLGKPPIHLMELRQ